MFVHTLQFLTAKILDIGLVTVYYFCIGFGLSSLIDKWLGDFTADDYTSKNSFLIFLEIVFHLFCLGILSYILRNLIERIPYPLEGYGGFHHIRLKEVQGGIVLSFVLIFFQKHLTDKIEYLKTRVLG
uniref:Uncharacterized protein n=1 Tax=viral metagenome TaxID=1070528 RepID=A0A6C0K2S8_9ZZZZ